jgi:hypothetical protein
VSSLVTSHWTKVQLKSSIRIGTKVEISRKGSTLGVKAEVEKIFSIYPKLLINAEFYGLVLAPRLKKGDTNEFGNSSPNPWGQCSNIY